MELRAGGYFSEKGFLEGKKAHRVMVSVGGVCGLWLSSLEECNISWNLGSRLYTYMYVYTSSDIYTFALCRY